MRLSCKGSQVQNFAARGLLTWVHSHLQTQSGVQHHLPTAAPREMQHAPAQGLPERRRPALEVLMRHLHSALIVTQVTTWVWRLQE